MLLHSQKQATSPASDPATSETDGENLFCFLVSPQAQGSPDCRPWLDWSRGIACLLLGYVEKRASASPALAFDQNVWQEGLNHIPLLTPRSSETDHATLPQNAALAQAIQTQLASSLGQDWPNSEDAAEDAAHFFALPAKRAAQRLATQSPYLLHLLVTTIDAGPDGLEGGIASIAIAYRVAPPPAPQEGVRNTPTTPSILTTRIVNQLRLDLSSLNNATTAEQLAFIRNANTGKALTPQNTLTLEAGGD
jgi:hypothetical protein